VICGSNSTVVLVRYDRSRTKEQKRHEEARRVLQMMISDWIVTVLFLIKSSSRQYPHIQCHFLSKKRTRASHDRYMLCSFVVDTVTPDLLLCVFLLERVDRQPLPL